MYLRLHRLRLVEAVSLVEGAQVEEVAQQAEGQGEANQGDLKMLLSLLSTPLRLLRNLSAGLRLKQLVSLKPVSLRHWKVSLNLSV